MKVALLFLLACVLTAVVDVQSSTYAVRGTHYPWARPVKSPAPNRPKTVQQNRRTWSPNLNSMLRTRRAADGSSQSTSVQQNPGAIFEEQRPIDFDLKVRPAVQFVPGLKSVVDLPGRDTPKA